MDIGQLDRLGVILRYIGLSASALNEKDKEKLSKINREKGELRKALGMTAKQINAEARNFLVRNK